MKLHRRQVPSNKFFKIIFYKFLCDPHSCCWNVSTHLRVRTSWFLLCIWNHYLSRETLSSQTSWYPATSETILSLSWYTTLESGELSSWDPWISGGYHQWLVWCPEKKFIIEYFEGKCHKIKSYLKQLFEWEFSDFVSIIITPARLCLWIFLFFVKMINQSCYQECLGKIEGCIHDIHSAAVLPWYSLRINWF